MTNDPLLEAILPPPDALPQTLRAARRRRTVRHALTVSPLVLAGVAAVLTAFNQPTPPQVAAVIPSTPTPPYLITTTTAHTIPTVPTTPASTVNTRPLAFATVTTKATPLPTISDDHLLALASTPGHPAAIVHHQGHPKLLSTHTR